MFACALIGLVLNLSGTVIAGWAVYSENRQHGGKAIVPMNAAYQWVRIKVFRRPPHLTRVASARSTSWMVATAKATGVVWPAGDAPVATQVAYLQRAVIQLHTVLAHERHEIDENAKKVQEQLSQRIGATEAGLNRAEDKIRGLATASVRWEVLGLFLVGLGSVISVLPAVLGWN